MDVHGVDHPADQQAAGKPRRPFFVHERGSIYSMNQCMKGTIPRVSSLARWPVAVGLLVALSAAVPSGASAQEQKLILPSPESASGKFVAVKGYERCNSTEKPRQLDHSNATLEPGEWLGFQCGDLFDDKSMAVVAEVAELRGFFGHCANLTDDGFKQAEKLVNLKYLRLVGGDKLTSKGFASLKAAKEMRSVSIGFSGAVDDTWLDVLAHWPKLLELELDNTRITGTGFRNLTHTPELVWLSGWNMYQLTDAAIEQIVKLPALTGLQLDGCRRLTADAFLKVRSCSKLRHLRLSDCEVMSDDIVAALCELSGLEALDLSRSKAISDEAAGKLAALTKLQTLSLSHCESLTDAAVKSISRISGIKRLRIGDCPKLTEQCLEDVLKLENLESIHAPQAWSKAARERLKKARPNIKFELI